MRMLLAGLGLMAGVGVGGAAGMLALWHHALEAAPQKVAAAKPAPPAPAPAPAPAVEEPVACRLEHRAMELRPTVRVRVPLHAAAVPGSSRIRLGYADSLYDATGIDVDAATLASRVTLSRMGVKPVSGVVPLENRFVIDRNDAGLDRSRTVAALVPFRLGFDHGTLSRAALGEAPEPVWPDPGRGKATEPAVASMAGVGHAVAFRLGGERGRVMVGWLAPDGAKKSPLGAIDVAAAALGTPAIARNGRKIAVAFAARGDETSPWGLRLTTAAAGELPRSARHFALPAGGPGHDAFAPTLTGLPGGRWLLQWTEGSRARHRVRAQTLDSDLSPIGSPVTLSPAGADAGQGVIQANGNHAAGFYLIKAKHGYQLWATSLACGAVR